MTTARAGTDGTRLWEGDQAQRLVFHMLASKLLPSFAKLEATDHLRRLAAHAYEFKVTRHGLWIKVSSSGKARAALAKRGRLGGWHHHRDRSGG